MLRGVDPSQNFENIFDRICSQLPEILNRKATELRAAIKERFCSYVASTPETPSLGDIYKFAWEQTQDGIVKDEPNTGNDTQNKNAPRKRLPPDVVLRFRLLFITLGTFYGYGDIYVSKGMGGTVSLRIKDPVEREPVASTGQQDPISLISSPTVLTMRPPPPPPPQLSQLPPALPLPEPTKKEKTPAPIAFDENNIIICKFPGCIPDKKAIKYHLKNETSQPTGYYGGSSGEKKNFFRHLTNQHCICMGKSQYSHYEKDLQTLSTLFPNYVAVHDKKDIYVEQPQRWAGRSPTKKDSCENFEIITAAATIATVVTATAATDTNQAFKRRNDNENEEEVEKKEEEEEEEEVTIKRPRRKHTRNELEATQSVINNVFNGYRYASWEQLNPKRIRIFFVSIGNEQDVIEVIREGYTCKFCIEYNGRKYTFCKYKYIEPFIQRCVNGYQSYQSYYTAQNCSNELQSAMYPEDFQQQCNSFIYPSARSQVGDFDYYQQPDNFSGNTYMFCAQQLENNIYPQQRYPCLQQQSCYPTQTNIAVANYEPLLQPPLPQPSLPQQGDINPALQPPPPNSYQQRSENGYSDFLNDYQQQQQQQQTVSIGLQPPPPLPPSQQQQEWEQQQQQQQASQYSYYDYPNQEQQSDHDAYTYYYENDMWDPTETTQQAYQNSTGYGNYNYYDYDSTKYSPNNNNNNNNNN